MKASEGRKSGMTLLKTCKRYSCIGVPINVIRVRVSFAVLDILFYYGPERTI